ncbi:ABC transporter substrate-binding protein [Halobacteriaceae archaeon GCM10025711]
MSHNRRNFLKAAGTAGIFATAGCLGGLGGGGSSGPFSIGMVDSRTGSLEEFGTRNKRGMELALADVNAVGIDGRDLDIIVEDSQSQQQAGVSAAQKLVNQDQVPLLIGAVSSGVSIAIHESVVQGTDVVQISQNSTSPKLSDYPDLMRMSPTGSLQAKALAQLIKEDGHSSVAITWLNNAYGQGVQEAFVDAYDGDIKYNQPHDQGKASYTNAVTGMADAGADAWLFISYQPEFTTMAQESYDKGYLGDVALYGSDSVKGPKVLQNIPEGSIDGMTIIAPSAALDQENYKRFAENFNSDYGRDPTAWSAYAYDAIVVGALGVQAADEFTGAAIGEVVRDITRPEGQKVYSFEEGQQLLADGASASEVNYEGVSGPIDLNEKGDPAAYEQIFEIQNHSYESTGFIST